MNLVEFFSDNQALLRIAISVLLVIVVTLIRRATIRLVRGRPDVLDAQKRRQLFYTRSTFNLVLALGLLMIWLGQVQNLVLSLTAVMVAVVLATKELLMCVSGFALRTGASSFSVGDWIEIAGMRGEVSEFDLLSTTVLEFDAQPDDYSFSGNKIVLPNSLFLTAPVRNLKHSRKFVLHRFTITLPADIDTDAVLAWLDGETQRLYAQFADQAREHSAAIDQKLGVDIPGPEPLTRLATSDTALPAFQVQLFCPTASARALEHEITTGLLRFLRAAPEPATAEG